MATRASIAARTQIARESAESSIERIAAGLDLELPPAAVAYTKDPEIRAVASMERTAAFLTTVADKVGAEPPAKPDAANADAPERQGPADETAEADDAAESQPEGDDGEPEIHGKPLSFYDGMSDDEILALPRVGDATLAKIRAAQAERDAK